VRLKFIRLLYKELGHPSKKYKELDLLIDKEVLSLYMYVPPPIHEPCVVVYRLPHPISPGTLKDNTIRHPASRRFIWVRGNQGFEGALPHENW
jgi:hypothetical protein